MFSERFVSDTWSYILFDNLYHAWDLVKNKLDLNSLINISSEKKIKKPNDDQLTLW